MKTLIYFDQSKLMKKMDNYQKTKVPQALSKTMNKMVYSVQQKLRADIDKYVDGGATPWTKSSIIYSQSSPTFLFASVYAEGNRPYMKTIIRGGTVTPLKNNKALLQPVAIKVNKYGNIPRNAIKTRAARSHLYFIGSPGNRPTGLYKRYKSKKKPELVVMMDNKSRYQKAIFPATRIAKGIVNRSYRNEFKKQMQRASF